MSSPASSTPASAPSSPTVSARNGISSFLTLAPVQSPTFPSAPPAFDAASSPELKPTEVVEPVAKERRSSSTARRFLKLGPVFWGGERGGDDYAVEEE